MSIDAPLLIYDLHWQNQKNMRQNILFRRTAWAQPMHMTHIMHTWGGVQLWKATWNSYVQSPTFVAREMSNDKFIIPKPVLPLASKWWVTHYPKVT